MLRDTSLPALRSRGHSDLLDAVCVLRLLAVNPGVFAQGRVASMNS